MEPEKLELTPKQVSHIAAGFLLMSFCVFIAGYYWGKKSSINPLTEQLEAESLSDKMFSAICSLNDIADLEKDDKDDTIQMDSQKETKQIVDNENKEKKAESPLYYAELAGFGTLKAAQACERNLALRGFAVKTVERKGSQRNWYQVVTYAEKDKEKLAQQLDQIKKIAHIKDVTIKTISKEN